MLGIPKKIRYDNMKTVVNYRDNSDKNNKKIVYNFDFLNFAKYYKFKPEACPPYYPRSKGKVEAMIKYLRYNFMQGKRFGKDFKTLKELNDKVKIWLKDCANARIHKTTGEKPILRWEIEKTLLYFPKEHEVYKSFFTQSRYASENAMVYYKKSSYEIPKEFSRMKIDIMEDDHTGLTKLLLYFKGNKIAEHEISNKPGGWKTLDNYKLEEYNNKNPITLEKRIKSNPLFNIEVEVRDNDYYDKFIK